MFETIESWALHAFADGELEGADRTSVERLLATDHEARRYMESIGSQKSALHRAYDPVLDEALPASLLNAINRNSPNRKSNFAAIAASVAMFIVGSAGGWFANHYVGDNASFTQSEHFTDRALFAHNVYATDFSHPVEIGQADSKQLRTWLSKRIGTDFNIPDLSSKGYSLIGGRLIAEDGVPAGLLMYESATKERLSIYLAANPDKDHQPMRIEYHGKLMTCYWVEPDLVYALVGTQTAEVMVPLTQLAHEGFDS